MTALGQLYGNSLALLTDLYQLTMAYGYWKNGLAEREAAFHLFFRRPPFGGGYAVACGLDTVLDYVSSFRPDAGDLAYLASLEGGDGKPLFDNDFIDYLSAMELKVDIDAMPEGTAAFAHEPLLRVTGPLLQAQVLETAFLNAINFQTLIATKAARICRAAGGAPVIDFGLRRAQGFDGGVSASRAAYVGGCTATSNVLAGKLLGIPVRGTHAHSWVMAFDSEPEAFAAYADAMPGNSVFLVDTYDTLEGIDNAIAAGRALRERGHEMLGVRLDSGDLAELSRAARRRLDEAGFTSASIVASNDLDEHEIGRLMENGAAIDTWGVGTNLVTARDQPALGGVYKLAAIRDEGGAWSHRVKLSEQDIKVSNPGLQQVQRYFRGDQMVADVIYDLDAGRSTGDQTFVIDIPARVRDLPPHTSSENLLVPAVRRGQVVAERPPLADVRARAAAQLEQLGAPHSRLRQPSIRWGSTPCCTRTRPTWLLRPAMPGPGREAAAHRRRRGQSNAPGLGR